MSIDQRLQAFFRIQQAFGLGSQTPFNHHSQHDDDEDEDEEMMILTLVIELAAVFPHLVALLLSSS